MLRRLLTTTPLLALLALLTAACEVRTAVDVTMAEDGSGTVEVAVGLDADALGRVPDLTDDGRSDAADLAQLLRVEDMRAAGWTVDEPAPEGSGTVWVRASKAFGTPEEAADVLSEVTGADGALRDVAFARSTGFAETSFDVSGTLDLSGGLEAFGDQGLAGALDGEALGEDAAAIEARLGQPLADAFTFDMRVSLPGEVDPGTGTAASGSTVDWSPKLGDAPVSLEASSTDRDATVLGLAVAAALAGALLVLALVARAGRRLFGRRD
jgi:hypothetical protein